MPSRCGKCHRLKVFGGGWVSRLGEWYCPACWADMLAEEEAERKRTEEASRRAAEAAQRVRAQIQSQAEEMRQRLELYSASKMPFPPEFVTPAVALAQHGLEAMDWVLRVREGSVERLKENFEQNVEPVVRPILTALNRIASQETTANVDDLIHLCFQLTRLQDIRLRYPDGIKFPVDVLIHLGGVDRTRTLQQLGAAVSDPNTDPRVRVLSIMALGRIGDQRAVDTLLGVLKEDRDDWGSIIPGAACALADLGDERAVMPIIHAIERHFYSGDFGDWTAREYIAERLGVLFRPGTDLYQEVCSAWRAAKETPTATELAATVKRAVLPVLERALVDCGGHEAVEIATEWACSGVNDEALKGTRALAKLDDEEALDVLCSVLATSRQVVVGYHDEGDMWGIPDYAPNTEQRILAANALVQRGSPQAMAALQRAIADEDAKVREAIGQLLSKSNQPIC